MNWRVKGVIQAALSSLPGGVYLNTLLQRTVGDLRDLHSSVSGKVSDWQVFMCHMRDLGILPNGLDYLEVGTGWYPTLPLCYSLVGARTIHTYDVTRHLSEKLSFRMLGYLEPHVDSIAYAGGAEPDWVRSRYRDLQQCDTLDSLLRSARIRYDAPHNAAETKLADASVDIIFSNSVLEHAPVESIRNIMKESFRILRPGGLAIHSVNCGDHYAYFDRKITPINYLSYSEAQWKPWNNSLLFQNRLRPQDFLTLAKEADLTIVLDKHTTRPELLRKLEGIRLSPQYESYCPEQLAATSIDFVAQRPATKVSIPFGIGSNRAAGLAGECN